MEHTWRQAGPVMLRDDERIDDLQRNQYGIIQRKGAFCFGMDAVLLSGFAVVKKGERMLDLGTGTGIIPILLTAKTEGEHFTGLEIQEESADMARRSVRYNHLEEKVDIVTGDIVEAGQLFALAHVGRDRDHLAVVVVFLQPRDNNRGIQSSGIRQDHFFDRLHASSFLSVRFRSLLCDFVAFFHIISAVVRFCKREKRIFMLSRLFLSP